ncbi:MAG: hypothetical protein KDI50_10470 [Candidatus Competibacteraceae bacterium]|nr:hypothetical protein [Candidatus Competibacteraceae bacterium]
MNMQIHRKQIIILMLAMVLAVVSYWVPLPQQSTPYAPSSLILHESTDSSAPSAETISYARESATIWRFPVALEIPQTPVRTVAASPVKELNSAPPPVKEMSSTQTLPTPRLMEQQDFVNDDMGYSPLMMPVKELDYRMKH